MRAFASSGESATATRIPKVYAKVDEPTGELSSGHAVELFFFDPHVVDIGDGVSNTVGILPGIEDLCLYLDDCCVAFRAWNRPG
jgi:hypothetical protein